MMDMALKTHKEDTYGWVLAAQRLLAVFRERGAARAGAPALGAGVAAGPPERTRMRYLAPR